MLIYYLKVNIIKREPICEPFVNKKTEFESKRLVFQFFANFYFIDVDSFFQQLHLFSTTSSSSGNTIVNKLHHQTNNWIHSFDSDVFIHIARYSSLESYFQSRIWCIKCFLTQLFCLWLDDVFHTKSFLSGS